MQRHLLPLGRLDIHKGCLETRLYLISPQTYVEVLAESCLTDMSQETDVYTKKIEAVIGLVATVLGCGLRIAVVTEVVQPLKTG